MAKKKSAAQKRAASKKKGTFVGFKKLSNKLKKKGVNNPDAVAAAIGRKKYGKAGFAKLAASGKKHKKKK